MGGVALAWSLSTRTSFSLPKIETLCFNLVGRKQMTSLRETNKQDGTQICRIMRQLHDMQEKPVAAQTAHTTEAFHCLGLKIPNHWYTNKQGKWCCRACGMYSFECMCCVHGKPSANWKCPETRFRGCSECGHASILETFGYSTDWVCSGCTHRNMEHVSDCEKCQKQNPGYIAALAAAEKKAMNMYQAIAIMLEVEAIRAKRAGKPESETSSFRETYDAVSGTVKVQQ